MYDFSIACINMIPVCEMNTALMVYSFDLKTFCDLSGRVADTLLSSDFGMKSKQKMN